MLLIPQDAPKGKTLKQIYIETSKEAGFTENDLPDFWYIVIERWLTQKRQDQDRPQVQWLGYVLQGRKAMLDELLGELEK